MKSEADLAALKSELLDWHNAELQAHLDNDLDFFVQDVADDYISVSGGEIRRLTIDDIQSKFTNYLGRTTFSEYKDLHEPIIGLSKDGSLAWSIVNVKVAGKRKMEDGTEADMGFISAWIMLYERQGNKWVRIADVSTFK